MEPKDVQAIVCPVDSTDSEYCLSKVPDFSADTPTNAEMQVRPVST